MRYLTRTARTAVMLLAAAAISACADAGSLTGNNPAEEALAQGAGQDVLFTVDAAAVLAPEAQARLERLRGEPTTAEVHVAHLSGTAGALLHGGRAVVLNVAPGKRYVAVGERLAERGPSSLSWGGPLRNEEGRVDLVLTEKGVSGVLQARGQTYTIRPIGPGVTAVVRVDLSRVPADHPLVPTPQPSAQRQATAPLPAPTPGAAAMGGPMQVIYAPATAGTYHDLLVAYTPSVASAYWDVTGLAQLSIDLANQSYQNSGVDLAVRLAGTHQVSYSETSRTHEQHLSAAQSTSDGRMDELNGIRNSTHADVVMLLVNDQDGAGWCGLAPVLPNMQNAYAVVHYGCIQYNFSFHHELGHVQGARHDRIESPTNTPFTYGHGYIAPNWAWRTVMAYGSSCGDCQRINYWSNPNKTYVDGQVMGTTTYEDNARVLNGTKTSIRDFRTLSHPENVTHVNAGVSGVTPKLSWSAVSGASSYQVYSCIVNNGSSYYDSCFTGVGGTSATTWQNYYPYPTQTGSLSGSYNCPRIAMYRVRTLSPEGLSGYFTQINVCVN